MIVYAKVRSNGEYHSHNIAHAVYGFMEMGFEIRKYETIDEIYDTVTNEDIVLDYIDQCLTIFNKFGVKPYLPDYPHCLKEFLGRKIWTDTMDNINSNPDKWGIFVKPKKEKAFTGRVISKPADLIGCGSCYENYEVLCSEVLDIEREWRAFVYYDSIIDIRPYKGNWHIQYDSDVIDKVLDQFRTWENRPVACSLDFAVINTTEKVMSLDSESDFITKMVPVEKTIFLEANDAYALGNYGLHHLDYAKLISARWSQLLNRKDECKF
jgi:hypothetical protein